MHFPLTMFSYDFPALLVITILWHQAEDPPRGTFSGTPNATSFFICSSASSCQSKGIIAGALQATGLAEGSTCSSMSGPVMPIRG